MTASDHFEEKKITGHESQGAIHQDKLLGSKLPSVK
jgi:hypothetical protein